MLVEDASQVLEPQPDEQTGNGVEADQPQPHSRVRHAASGSCWAGATQCRGQGGPRTRGVDLLRPLNPARIFGRRPVGEHLDLILGGS